MRGTIKHTKIKSINARLFCVFAAVVACLFICFSLAFTSANKAYAEEQGFDVTFTANQILESVTGQEMDQTYSYMLEALTEGAPMPEGVPGRTMSIENITGNTSFQFNIDYSKAKQTGNNPYQYKLRMVVDKPKDGYTYPCEYRIDVYVVPEGTFVFYTDLSIPDKRAELNFKVTYNEQPGPGPEPTPTPTPDPTRPPQTLDAATIFMIFVGFIALFAVGLFVYSQGKKKKQ